ncbi:MAG TPA: hemerythrin domain-containing protein [Trebonia sp.]
MPSAFDVLAMDHEEVKGMLSELELGPTAATGANSDQLALRKKMVQQLVIEESKHEAVEEMYFWPTVREALTDGTDLANQAQDQEQEGKVVLDRLDKLSPEDEEFEGLLAQFIQAGRAHIAFEETTVWPSLRSVLTAEQADELGGKLEAGKKTAPTRPHPKTPASPGVLKTAGPAVAAADKLRDKATGRDE